VRIIAEPGRYFVASAFTLAVNVIARRTIKIMAAATVVDDTKTNSVSKKTGTTSFMYYVNDGVYGSFNCVMFDHQVVHPYVLYRNGMWVYGSDMDAILSHCTVWGPTCDSIDLVVPATQECRLPVLDVGDWIAFDHMGAYTMCAASEFNGFKKSRVVYTDTTGVVRTIFG